MTVVAPFVHIVDDDWAIRESLTMLLESEDSERGVSLPP